MRILNVLDVYTREALAIEVDTSLSGVRVARVLNRVIAERGAHPAEIAMGNGPELTSKTLDQWAYARDVRLHFIEPGEPVRNCFAESFNDKLRDECLNDHWFTTVWDAREKTGACRVEYNCERPHSSLGNQTPEEFRRSSTERQDQPGRALINKWTKDRGQVRQGPTASAARRQCAGHHPNWWKAHSGKRRLKLANARRTLGVSCIRPLLSNVEAMIAACFVRSPASPFTASTTMSNPEESRVSKIKYSAKY